MRTGAPSEATSTLSPYTLGILSYFQPISSIQLQNVSNSEEETSEIIHIWVSILLFSRLFLMRHLHLSRLCLQIISSHLACVPYLCLPDKFRVPKQGISARLSSNPRISTYGSVPKSHVLPPPCKPFSLSYIREVSRPVFRAHA